MFTGRLNESVADVGARRVLGINGSLLGYINTGNPYDKDYFCPQKKPEKQKSEENAKKCNKAPKYAIAGLLAGASLTGGAILLSKGKNAGKIFSNAKDFLAENFSKISRRFTANDKSAKAANNAAGNVGNKAANKADKCKIPALPPAKTRLALPPGRG